MCFTTFVLFDMFNALSCRSETKSVFQLGLLSNKPLAVAIAVSVLAQVAVIYVPPLQGVFQTEALSAWDLGLATAVASSVLVVDEVRKAANAARMGRRAGRRGRGQRSRVAQQEDADDTPGTPVFVQDDDAATSRLLRRGTAV